VKGTGFGVNDTAGYGFKGSWGYSVGCRVLGFGFRVYGLGFRGIYGSGFIG
jgi:hypothetical protein